MTYKTKLSNPKLISKVLFLIFIKWILSSFDKQTKTASTDRKEFLLDTQYLVVLSKLTPNENRSNRVPLKCEHLPKITAFSVVFKAFIIKLPNAKKFLTPSICNNNPPGTCLIDGGLKLIKRQNVESTLIQSCVRAVVAAIEEKSIRVLFCSVWRPCLSVLKRNKTKMFSFQI